MKGWNTVNNLNVYSATELNDYQVPLTIQTSPTAKGANQKVITANGGVIQSSTILTPFGDYSGIGVFDGVDDYLTTPDSADLEFGSNNFTIEFWIKRNALNTEQWVITKGIAFTDGSIRVDIESNNTIAFGITATSTGSFTNVISTAITDILWHHVACCKYNNQIGIAIDGTFGTWVSCSLTANNNASVWTIGQNADNQYYLNGILCGLRFSSIARYTTNFTPQTTPFTPDQYTKLLLHFNNLDQPTQFFDDSDSGIYIPNLNSDLSDLRITDDHSTILPYWIRNDGGGLPSSPDGKTITANGNVTQYNEHNGVTSPVQNCGMAYFDGNGDYLTVANHTDFVAGTNFTWEFFIYPKDVTTIQYIISQSNGTAIYPVWICRIQTNGTLLFYSYINASTYVTWVAGAQLTLNTQTHIAIVKQGTTYTLYQNGSQVATNTESTTFPTISQPLFIGGDSGGAYFNAYLSEVRFSNVARYTTNFTPPTTSFIPDQYTKLLLHFNNGPYAPTQFLDDSTGKYEVWCRVPKLLTGNNTLQLHSGNANATSISNGEAVFELFDHFNGTTYNSNWSIISGYNSGSISISNSNMIVTGGSGAWEYIKHNKTFPANIILEGRVNPITDVAGWVFGMYDAIPASNTTTIVHTSSGVKYYVTAASSSETDTTRSSSLTTYTLLKIVRISSTSVAFYENNTLVATITTNVPTANLDVRFGRYGTSYGYYDWVLIRKYTPTDPIITAITSSTPVEIEPTGNVMVVGGPYGNANRKSMQLRLP